MQTGMVGNSLHQTNSGLYSVISIRIMWSWCLCTHKWPDFLFMYLWSRLDQQWNIAGMYCRCEWMRITSTTLLQRPGSSVHQFARLLCMRTMSEWWDSQLNFWARQVQLDLHWYLNDLHFNNSFLKAIPEMGTIAMIWTNVNLTMAAVVFHHLFNVLTREWVNWV